MDRLEKYNLQSLKIETFKASKDGHGFIQTIAVCTFCKNKLHSNSIVAGGLGVTS